MITFRSTATGPLQMFDEHGAQVLAALGRGDPTRGVIMPEQMDDAIARLEAASASAAPAEDAATIEDREIEASAADAELPVMFRQRAFPLLQMLKSSRIAGAPVLWGI